MLMHVLRFLGMLALMSLVVHYIPYGVLFGSVVCICGIWKLTE